MLCISIGTNCVPKAQIEKFCTQEKKYLPFDKTYENFECVLKIMRNLENPDEIVKEEDFVAVSKYYLNTTLKTFMPHENHTKSEIYRTNFSCVEVKPNIKTYEQNVPKVVESYIEKINTLKETIKNNNKIMFLHFISEESMTPKTSFLKFVTSISLNESILNYMSDCKKTISKYLPTSLDISSFFSTSEYFPTKDNVNEFFYCVKQINPHCEAHLFFVLPPEISNHYDKIHELKTIQNVYVHLLSETNVCDNNKKWTRSELDWNMVFDKIKSL